MSTIKALIVHPEANAATTYELPVESQLAALQGIVGGYIEAAYSADRTLTFWINEEGKLHGLPVNEFATAVWWLFNPAAVNKDVLVGPVLITGGADAVGDTLPIPDAAAATIGKLYLEVEHADDD
jgi:hypothetical protein